MSSIAQVVEISKNYVFISALIFNQLCSCINSIMVLVAINQFQMCEFHLCKRSFALFLLIVLASPRLVRALFQKKIHWDPRLLGITLCHVTSICNCLQIVVSP